MPKYVCSNNANHVFDKMTGDGFCPEAGCYGVGFLVEQQNSQTGAGSVPSSTIGAKEIGLCVLLMDASGSMDSSAFSSNPATKAQLVAGSASGGIFDLAKLSNTDDAYIIGVMFDREPHPIFTSSITEILKTYSNASNFAEFLRSKFTHGGTDINRALNFARQIYDDFIQKGDLSQYKGPQNVKPIKHSILNKKR